MRLTLVQKLIHGDEEHHEVLGRVLGLQRFKRCIVRARRASERGCVHDHRDVAREGGERRRRHSVHLECRE